MSWTASARAHHAAVPSLCLPYAFPCWRRAVRATAQVEPRGGRFVVLGDYAQSGELTAWQDLEARVVRLVEPLVSSRASSHYLSLLRLFCDDESSRCSDVVPGTGVRAFFDEQHLNVAGSIFAWPYLCDAMHSKGLLP